MGIAQRLEEAKRKESLPKKSTKVEETKKAEAVPPKKVVEKPIMEKIDLGIKNLPSEKEKLRSAFSKRLEVHMENLQETIFRATRALNDVTGYSGIEKLKKSVENLEEELKSKKQTVKDSKLAYSEAIQKRSDSQKEINELLTRKHNWGPADVERFTELYRNDHTNQQEEETAEQQLAEAESEVDSVQNKLTQSILTRYHEEQIWSDKIRQASTWGTWIIMGINVLLFTVATFLVEPWKRRRLVNAFDAQVQQKMDSFSAEMRALAAGAAVPEKSSIKEESKATDAYVISFSGVSTWESFRNWIARYYNAVKNTQSSFFLQHQDFAILSAVMIGFGSILGGLFTHLLKTYIL
ncbi:hypothetical protein FDK38_003772 [Candidozyma auris]|nr:hypothetical protein FDK38_003772 [[Candida] auris]